MSNSIVRDMLEALEVQHINELMDDGKHYIIEVCKRIASENKKQREASELERNAAIQSAVISEKRAEKAEAALADISEHPKGTVFTKDKATWPEIGQEYAYRFSRYKGYHPYINADVFNENESSINILIDGGCMWWPIGDLFEPPNRSKS